MSIKRKLKLSKLNLYFHFINDYIFGYQCLSPFLWILMKLCCSLEAKTSPMGRIPEVMMQSEQKLKVCFTFFLYCSNHITAFVQNRQLDISSFLAMTSLLFNVS